MRDRRPPLTLLPAHAASGRAAASRLGPATRLGFLALALCAIGAAPSHGQFYSLEGRYQCLDDPKAVCYDATSSKSAAKPRPEPQFHSAPVSAEPTRPEAKADRARVAPAPSRTAAIDPLSEMATRLQGGTAAPPDIALLRGRTAAGDKRATELLAWCHLKGVGVRQDPVPAYLLYGVAARLGVLDAERNQAIVYETDMTSEQQQQALAIENRVMLPP
jgi:TPR repeat protein